MTSEDFCRRRRHPSTSELDEADLDFMEENCSITSVDRRDKLKRLFRGKDKTIVQIKNVTDTTICIICTQDLASVLSNGGAGLNAGVAGVDLRLDIAKELVGMKEIKSVLKLGPDESQEIMVTSKYTVVSVFAIQGETMTLLLKNAPLKRGHSLTVEQRDIVNALSHEEFTSLTSAWDQRD